MYGLKYLDLLELKQLFHSGLIFAAVLTYYLAYISHSARAAALGYIQVNCTIYKCFFHSVFSSN